MKNSESKCARRSGDEVFDRIQVATRLSSRLGEYGLEDVEEIRRSFEELIGKPVGETFHLVPPFYADYGLNITVGRAVFIGYQCAFTGQRPSPSRMR